MNAQCIGCIKKGHECYDCEYRDWIIDEDIWRPVPLNNE
jgi:hypothetical protein